jgi:hypothetical protein
MAKARCSGGFDSVAKVFLFDFLKLQRYPYKFKQLSVASRTEELVDVIVQEVLMPKQPVKQSMMIRVQDDASYQVLIIAGP